MSLLATIRRLHAPLVGIAIACVFSVGCRSGWRDYEIRLGAPQAAYAVSDGTLMYGYRVENRAQRDFSGWHWLTVGPETAEALMRPADADAPSHIPAPVLVTYTGDSPNARLDPPLLSPGLSSDNPPVLDGLEVRELEFVYNAQWDGPRLIDPDGQVLPLLLVSPLYVVDEHERDSGLSGVGRALGWTLKVAGILALGVAVLYVSSLEDDDEDDWP